jgi:hypothetical protein
MADEYDVHGGIDGRARSAIRDLEVDDFVLKP